MSKRLVLVGGGHAHMQTLVEVRNLVDTGHSVHLVSPSPFYYYSGMGPGAFGGRYDRREIRFDLQRMVEMRGGTFLRDSAVRINREERTVTLASGRELSWDVLSCNVGSSVRRDQIELGAGDWFPVKPIERLLDARQRLLELLEHGPERITCLVIGGGAASVEIAANAWRLARERGPADGGRRLTIRLIAGGELLSGFPKRLRRRAVRSLKRRGILLETRTMVSTIDDGVLWTTDGHRFQADLVLLATGVTPSPLFQDSGLPVGEDGGLLVNRNLQSVAHERIFAGGDCLSFEPGPLDRVGVYAARQNPVLANNISAALDERWEELRPFKPGGNYLLALNMGDGTGLVSRNGIVLGGRVGFRLKEYLDRGFMGRYQVEERSEEPVGQ
jgi:NADH dehydrogenase FAD-containing subunit